MEIGDPAVLSVSRRIRPLDVRASNGREVLRAAVARGAWVGRPASPATASCRVGADANPPKNRYRTPVEGQVLDLLMGVSHFLLASAESVSHTDLGPGDAVMGGGAWER